ncbi:MAG: dethiobiotin synthase [Acidobacteriota bacterium]
MRGYFVTGTDTGVGKTVLSAALAIRLQAGYWKPVQTGSESDSWQVKQLASCPIFDDGIRLPDPLSPHLAARNANTRITVLELLALATTLDAQSPWIIEGAGGALVPLNETQLLVDWMKVLRLPVIIASRSTLGTINHTLLTLEALRSRSIEIAGVVMIGPPNADNRQAIEHFGNVPVLAEMPLFDALTPEIVRTWALANFQDLQP